MTDYKNTLAQLNKNLAILREREAKYGGNAPLDLLNQITDHQTAITLTKQAITEEITEADWREALRPLLVNIRDRSESQPEACGVTIGDVEGGIIGSIIAGGDVSNVQIAHGSNIAQASNGGHAEVNVSTFDQRGQQVNGDQYNAGRDIHIDQPPKESPAWRVWTVFLGIVTIIGVIIALFTVPQFNALVFPDPTPTPTPLPVTPATEGESLILIATFHETGSTKTEPHVKIKRAIEAAAQEVGLATLRVEIEPNILTADQRPEAEALGKQYNAAMVIWGEDTGVQVLVNFLNLKQPDFAAAEVEIDETERTQLTNPDAYARFILSDLPGQLTFLSFFTVGQSFFQAQNYSQAQKVIEQGTTSLAVDTPVIGLADAYFRLGWLYQEVSKDMAVAIGKYSHAIKLDPKYAKAYNNRGNILYAYNNLIEAINNYNQAIKLDPNYAYAYYNRGNALYAQGHLAEAITDYNQAIKLDPTFAYAYYNRGVAIQAQRGDFTTAIADYTQAIELHPELASAYNSRGLAFYAQGNLAAAISDYNKAIKLVQKSAPASHNKGGNSSTQIIKLVPMFAQVYNNRGLAFKTQGDLMAAMADYTKAVELNPEYADAFYNTACIYALQNNVEATLPLLHRALELDTPRYLELIPIDSDFDLIHDDPRFKALVAEFAQKSAATTPEKTIEP